MEVDKQGKKTTRIARRAPSFTWGGLSSSSGGSFLHPKYIGVIWGSDVQWTVSFGDGGEGAWILPYLDFRMSVSK